MNRTLLLALSGVGLGLCLLRPATADPTATIDPFTVCNEGVRGRPVADVVTACTALIQRQNMFYVQIGWNQRGVAYCALGQYAMAVQDFKANAAYWSDLVKKDQDLATTSTDPTAQDNISTDKYNAESSLQSLADATKAAAGDKTTDCAAWADFVRKNKN